MSSVGRAGVCIGRGLGNRLAAVLLAAVHLQQKMHSQTLGLPAVLGD